MGIALFYAIENWRGKAAWEKYRREAAVRGEPIQLSAVIPPEVDDAGNFAMTPFLATGISFTTPSRPAQSLRRDTMPPPGRWIGPNGPAPPGSIRGLRHRLTCWPGIGPSSKRLTPLLRMGQGGGARLPARPVRRRRRSGGTGSGPGYGLAGEQSGDGKSGTAPAGITLREAAAGVLAELEECRPVFEELRSASQRPHSRFRINYANPNPAAILLPHLAVLKHLSQVLQLRASAELALGRTDEAFEDVMLMLYLSGACGDEPFLISHLVRIAQFQLALQPLAEELAEHQWSGAQLRGLQDRLGRLDFCADARRVLHGERVFFGCGTIRYVRRSRGDVREIRAGRKPFCSSPRAAGFAWSSSTCAAPSMTGSCPALMSRGGRFIRPALSRRMKKPARGRWSTRRLGWF